MNRKFWAIDIKNKKLWLEQQSYIPNKSGIYVIVRQDGVFKYAYVGQSKHILQRLAEHLRGYMHIDASLQKRGLWSEKNQGGWKLKMFLTCDEEYLDSLEQQFIEEYAKLGYQMKYNHTGGGQLDKIVFEKHQTNGYRKGVAYGKEKMLKEIKLYFDKYLDFVIKDKTNKIKEKKFNEFKNLIENS